MNEGQIILQGDCRETLKTLPKGSVHCVVTSPPYYGLRDYGVNGQIGLEPTPQAFIDEMVSVFRELRRLLRDDGTVWLNIGDSYSGSKNGSGDNRDVNKNRSMSLHPDKYRGQRPGNAKGFKPKDKMLIPHRLAIALQADGWWVRQDNVWHKPSPMPMSVRDNTTGAHEYVFLLTKSAKYHYDWFAVSEECSENTNSRGIANAPKAANTIKTGSLDPKQNESFQRNCSAMVDRRNKRSVWKIASESYNGAHFACFPTKLAEVCILAGCPDQCCDMCGMPYERVIETERVTTRPGNESKVGDRGEGWDHQNIDSMQRGYRDPERHVTKYVDRGFEQQCECNGRPIGGVVLDPFLGSGTTLQVAKELGRRGIGCELNQEYIELAWKRIGDQQMLAF